MKECKWLGVVNVYSNGLQVMSRAGFSTQRRQVRLLRAFPIRVHLSFPYTHYHPPEPPYTLTEAFLTDPVCTAKPDDSVRIDTSAFCLTMRYDILKHTCTLFLGRQE